MRKSVCASAASCLWRSIPDTWLRPWASGHLLKEITIQRRECCRGIGFFDLLLQELVQTRCPSRRGKKNGEWNQQAKMLFSCSVQGGNNQINTDKHITHAQHTHDICKSEYLVTVICFVYRDAQNVRLSRHSGINSCRVLVGRLAAR